MKRVLIALLILASSAAFANTPGDPEVTVENWGFMTDGKVVSDLADNNGFTVPAYSFYGDENTRFIGSAAGWLVDPNDSVSVTVIEDFSAEQMSSYNGNFYVTVFGVPDMQSRDAVMYAAPYTGPGDYTLELANVFGDIEEGSEMSYILFAIADYNSDGYVTQNLIMPGENTITVRFNSAEQETVVPEPTTCAYALMGLGSLLGIKRRVKK